MALGDPYATVAELKGYAEHFADTVDDTQLTEVLLQASRAVEHVCRRQFNKATSATARFFYPDGTTLTALRDNGMHDFWTSTSLVIATDTTADGTYATTWASTDYQLEPLNGIVDGESGWPYYTIRAVGNNTFPTYYLNTIAPLKVTAQWGWTAVPTNVKVACIYTALETFKLKGAPFGVANTDQFGPIRVRQNQRVMDMLHPYIWQPVLVG